MANSTVGKKIDAANLFDCSDLSVFNSSIVQILPYKGVSRSNFYMCEIDGVYFLTKMCFYRRDFREAGTDGRDLVPTTDAEINILKILNKRIVKKGLSHCILELVYHKTCTGISKMLPSSRTCEKLVLEREPKPHDYLAHSLCTYYDQVKNGLAHDKCAFLVLDKCDINLDDYLRRSALTSINVAVFKTLLFQIIHAFYVIKKIYPGFRHYDLHSENVMLKFDESYKFTASSPKFLVYNIDGEVYSVPYFGIIPKIIDFGFSSLPEEGYVSLATTDKWRMYSRVENDLLLLFYWIYDASLYGNDKLGRIDKLLQNLEPNRTYVHYYAEYIRKNADRIPTYEDMIKNKVWNEYKKISVPKNQIYLEFPAVI